MIVNRFMKPFSITSVLYTLRKPTIANLLHSSIHTYSEDNGDTINKNTAHILVGSFTLMLHFIWLNKELNAIFNVISIVKLSK